MMADEKSIPTLTAHQSAIAAVRDQMDITQVMCPVSSCDVLCNAGGIKRFSILLCYYQCSEVAPSQK